MTQGSPFRVALPTEEHSVSNKVAIIGTGTIGLGWAVTFSRAGWSVVLMDQDIDVTNKAKLRAEQIIASQKACLIDEGLESQTSITCSCDVSAAVTGANLIIEAVPEVLAIKQGVLKEIERFADPETIIGSSTSAILPSSIAANMTHPERFIVTHPFNPSYLIPVVEVVPAVQTAQNVVDITCNILTSLGMRPVSVLLEIEGFVANRLQCAIVNESINLVSNGVASVEDVEACITDCLGLRWAVYGPLSTMHNNAVGGFAEYAGKFGSSYSLLGEQLDLGATWSDEVIGEIDRQLTCGSEGLTRKQELKLRDEAVQAIIACKQSIKQSLEDVRQQNKKVEND